MDLESGRVLRPWTVPIYPRFVESGLNLSHGYSSSGGMTSVTDMMSQSDLTRAGDWSPSPWNGQGAGPIGLRLHGFWLASIAKLLFCLSQKKNLEIHSANEQTQTRAFT